MVTAKWFPKLTPTTLLPVAARTVLGARCDVVERRLQNLKSRSVRDPEDVHQLRVSTRRLAAALSIFKACLDPESHRRLRRAARKLRRAAGAARDFDVQRELLTGRLHDANRSRLAVVKICDAELNRHRRSI